MRIPYALLVLTLCVHARAEPAKDAPAEAEIAGRVFERGSFAAINGARVLADNGATVASDDEGRFSLRVPGGPVALAITLDGYEPLRLVEQLRPGQRLVVEYRLTRLPQYKKRYVSTVRGEGAHEGERFAIRDEELHQTAGTLGNPFAIVGLLPGVSTPLSLLPIYVIRGASPGTNGFFLDGMRVPQLFHFFVLVGGGVVHPRLIDRVDFYPGVYDASFGHYAGGIIDSETRAGRRDAPAHAELELKIYDVSGLVEAKLPKGVSVVAAGHYGFPGYIIKAFDNRADLSYWDAQLRVDWKTLTFEALGSYDFLSIVTDQGRPATPTRPARPATVTQNQTEFYRVQLRDRRKLGRVDTEAALVGGYDAFQALGPSVQKLSLGWRASLRARLPRLRLAFGVDGEVSRFAGQDFVPGTGADQPDAFGELNGNRDGVEAGAYAEATIEIWKRRLYATLGVRADVYHARAVTLLGVDPRFQFRMRLLPELSINGGIGLYQQPPSFPIALPGIDTFALQLGLQRAVQSAFGVEAELPLATQLKLTGFWQQFYNVNDAVLDFSIALCTQPPPESLTGFPARVINQTRGHAYGLEVLVRRRAGRFTGWVAYTLSRAERIYSCGLRPADYDQSHVLNVVGQVRLPWHLMVGARLLFQTGRPVTILDPPDGRSTVRNNHRLPSYVELDLRVDREWIWKRWALDVFLEVLNLTYSQSVIGITYPVDDNDITRYDMPQLNGFRWILPTIGVRGRF